MDIERRFPRRVVIENTTACNARCLFCPREKLTRKIETMEFDVFRKLLDDCVAAGSKKLSLHNFGEPLVDKNLAEKVRYAKSKGVEETFIVTNASLLTPERSEELIEAGIDRIKISFQGITKEEYESFHVNLNYEESVCNVEQLVDAKRRHGGAKPKIIIRYMGRPLDFITFWRRWRRLKPHLSIIPGRFHNYSTGRSYNPISNVRRPNFMKSCRYVKRPVVYILVNGDVVPCCYDFNGVLNMGNALEQSISEIWNGEKFKAFRLAHKRHEFNKYPICAGCDKLNYILI